MADHRPDVRLESAPPLEGPEHSVIVFDQPQLHFRRELFRLIRIHPLAATDRGDDLLDDWQFLYEEFAWFGHGPGGESQRPDSAAHFGNSLVRDGWENTP